MIAFISCVKTKKKGPCKAKDLYCSILFKKSFEYAEKRANKVYILSAKYGLLKPDDIISYYNLTLNNMKEKERKKWAFYVYQQIINAGIDINEDAIFLCGINYRKYLMQKFPNSKCPIEGLSMGNLLKFYKENQ